jgi:hypothetical protein
MMATRRCRQRRRAGSSALMRRTTMPGRPSCAATSAYVALSAAGCYPRLCGRGRRGGCGPRR